MGFGLRVVEWSKGLGYITFQSVIPSGVVKSTLHTAWYLCPGKDSPGAMHANAADAFIDTQEFAAMTSSRREHRDGTMLEGRHATLLPFTSYECTYIFEANGIIKKNNKEERYLQRHEKNTGFRMRLGSDDKKDKIPNHAWLLMLCTCSIGRHSASRGQVT